MLICEHGNLVLRTLGLSTVLSIQGDTEKTFVRFFFFPHTSSFSPIHSFKQANAINYSAKKKHSKILSTLPLPLSLSSEQQCSGLGSVKCQSSLILQAVFVLARVFPQISRSWRQEATVRLQFSLMLAHPDWAFYKYAFIVHKACQCFLSALILTKKFKLYLTKVYCCIFHCHDSQTCFVKLSAVSIFVLTHVCDRFFISCLYLRI